MQISREADYAVRAVVELAREPSDRRLRSADIALRQHIPAGFLTRIMARLAAAGVVEAQRGVGGGVRLARPARDITLLEVVELVEGPLNLNRCVWNPGECPLDTICTVHPVWEQVAGELRTRLAGISFESLLP